MGLRVPASALLSGVTGSHTAPMRKMRTGVVSLVRKHWAWYVRHIAAAGGQPSRVLFSPLIHLSIPSLRIVFLALKHTE